MARNSAALVANVAEPFSDMFLHTGHGDPKDTLSSSWVGSSSGS
jgi:hypothetical protein